MAGTNEIQVGRFNAVLQKVLAIKEGAPAPTLAPEITPAIILENDRPEWYYPGGVRLAGGGTRVGPVIGELPQLQLFNPAGSGILVVVTKVIVSSATAITATEFWTGWSRSALPSSSGNKGPRDSRYSSTVSLVPATAELRLTTAVGPPSLFVILGNHLLPPNPAPITLQPNVVLDPDSGYTLYSSLSGADFSVSFEWYERALEPEETR